MALICMGRLKEKYWRDAANEYEKRLSRFGKFEEIELPDLPEPANSSPAVEAQICEKEGRAILQKVREDDVVIALCIGGKQLDSVQLSEKLTQFGGWCSSSAARWGFRRRWSRGRISSCRFPR